MMNNGFRTMDVRPHELGFVQYFVFELSNKANYVCLAAIVL